MRTLKKTFVVCTLMTFVWGTLPAKKADAAVGVIIALTSKSQNMKTIGWVIAGIGGLAALAADSEEKPGTTQTCTPSNPCPSQCTDVEDNYDTDGNVDGTYCAADTGPITSGTQTPYVSDPHQGGINFGLILLGETDIQGNIELSQIDPTTKGLGVTSQQIMAFNKELPQVDLIFNSILSQLNEEATQGLAETQIKADSAQLWTQAKSVLSNDAYTVLKKIAEDYHS